ncbi:MAG: hypothetical protein ACFFB0_12920 [Promethearchaeota archaeon]
MKVIESIHIDDRSYRRLIDLLRGKTGLNFEYYNPMFVEKRIKSRRIRVNCQSAEEYYEYLSSKKEEIRKFVDGFTINFTFFFRFFYLSNFKKYKSFLLLLFRLGDLFLSRR